MKHPSRAPGFCASRRRTFSQVKASRDRVRSGGLRFLQTDPIEGGNANAYTYPNDPVNMVDLNGEWGWCWKFWTNCRGKGGGRGGKAAKAGWLAAGALGAGLNLFNPHVNGEPIRKEPGVHAPGPKRPDRPSIFNVSVAAPPASVTWLGAMARGQHWQAYAGMTVAAGGLAYLAYLGLLALAA